MLILSIEFTCKLLEFENGIILIFLLSGSKLSTDDIHQIQIFVDKMIKARSPEIAGDIECVQNTYMYKWTHEVVLLTSANRPIYVMFCN